jgi:CCR4-NOT transcription complex subunit 1
VLPLFEPPLTYCPEVLLASLVHARTGSWTQLQRSVCDLLFAIFLGGHPNASAALARTAAERPQLVLNGLLDWYRKNPDAQRLNRVLDMAQQLNILGSMLQHREVRVVLDLAVEASRRSLVRLDQWLADRLQGEMPVGNAQGIAGVLGAYSSPALAAVPIPQDALRTILQAMQPLLPSLSPAVVGQLKAVADEHGIPFSLEGVNITLLPSSSAGGSGGGVGSSASSDSTPLNAAFLQTRSNPSAASSSTAALARPVGSTGAAYSVPASAFVSIGGGVIGNSNSNGGSYAADGGLPADMSDLAERTFSKSIDDEANSYFQKTYTGAMTVEEVVGLLSAFRVSSNANERDTFACMIRNLFDEYRFFPQYPPKELRITGVLFGSLVQRGLLTGNVQRVALHHVLEALRSDANSKRFQFGQYALSMFQSRLGEWPSFCAALLTVPGVVLLPAELQTAIRVSASAGGGSNNGSGAAAAPGLAGENDLFGSGNNFRLDRSPAGGGLSGGTGASTSATATSSSSNNNNSAAIAPGVWTSSVSAAAAAGNPRSLVEGSNVAQPTEELKERVAFIFNNLSEENMEKKVQELKSFLNPACFQWLAQYLVTDRARREPNYHHLYGCFLDAMDEPAFRAAVLGETYRHIAGILRSQQLGSRAKTQFTAERDSLKNLGAWLGLQTLARNKPVLYRDLQLKELLLSAYEIGMNALVLVIPFVAKVLEAGKYGRVFVPPNPWLMCIMGILKELAPDLSLNLKFELELLCKAF